MGKRVEGWYGEQFPNQSISQCFVRLYCGRGVVGGFLRKTPMHSQGFHSGSPVSNGDQDQFTVNNQPQEYGTGFLNTEPHGSDCKHSNVPERG